MAKLKVTLKSEGVIDNASIYLEDPQESIEYGLNPKSDNEWLRDVTLPIAEELDYSLHVVAFTGTHFTCTIENLDNGNTIELEGVTGSQIRNRANIKGSQNI